MMSTSGYICKFQALGIKFSKCSGNIVYFLRYNEYTLILIPVYSWTDS